MPTSSLAELHEQGRHNYVYWPLWLVLKQRQVEYLLMQTHPEIKLLRSLTIPMPEDIPTFTLPQTERLAGSDFHFEFNSVDNVSTLVCKRQHDRQTETCVLLQAANENDWYLQHAADQFNLALKDNDASLVFNAARLWVLFHGQALPQIQWVANKEKIVETGWE